MRERLMCEGTMVETAPSSACILSDRPTGAVSSGLSAVASCEGTPCRHEGTREPCDEHGAAVETYFKPVKNSRADSDSLASVCAFGSNKQHSVLVTGNSFPGIKLLCFAPVGLFPHLSAEPVPDVSTLPGAAGDSTAAAVFNQHSPCPTSVQYAQAGFAQHC